jgi:hypothetical protein
MHVYKNLTKLNRKHQHQFLLKATKYYPNIEEMEQSAYFKHMKLKKNVYKIRLWILNIYCNKDIVNIRQLKSVHKKT